jgi:lipopolysaccharide export system permease protein
VRIIRRYITTEFLTAFVVSIAVLTFVMSVGVVFKATDLLAKGGSWRAILLVLASGLPTTLTFSVPVSVLTSCLLVFGRLSADGEITAMRACGIGMWRIMQSPLLLSLLLAVLCVHVNGNLAPRGHQMRRALRQELLATSPVDLLEAGRFIQDFAGMTVYIGRKNGNELKDVRIYDLRTPGVKREVRAREGTVLMSDDGRDLVIDLRDVRVDPFLDDRPGAMFAERWPIRIANAWDKRSSGERAKDLVLSDLTGRLFDVAHYFPDLNEADLEVTRMEFSVELNKRLSLAAACFAFALLGMPLGVRAHRKESSVGVALSLLLMFVFYLFIIVAHTLDRRPEFRPDLIVWLPVLLAAWLGVRFVRRAG